MASTSTQAVRDVAYVAVFAALIIVFAFVAIPTGTGVPIVIQNALIILTGLILGARRGFLSVLLVLAVGVLGLPVLAGGRSTIVAMSGPTAGYVVGYVFAALIVGWIAYRAPQSKLGMLAVFAVAGVIGLATQYAFGILGLMLRTQMTFEKAVLAQGPFIGLDLIKVGVAVVVAVAIHLALPDLIGRRNR